MAGILAALSACISSFYWQKKDFSSTMVKKVLTYCLPVLFSVYGGYEMTETNGTAGSIFCGRRGRLRYNPESELDSAPGWYLNDRHRMLDHWKSNRLAQSAKMLIAGGTTMTDRAQRTSDAIREYRHLRSMVESKRLNDRERENVRARANALAVRFNLTTRRI
jgi:hypothetical protein